MRLLALETKLYRNLNLRATCKPRCDEHVQTPSCPIHAICIHWTSTPRASMLKNAFVVSRSRKSSFSLTVSRGFFSTPASRSTRITASFPLFAATASGVSPLCSTPLSCQYLTPAEEPVPTHCASCYRLTIFNLMHALSNIPRAYLVHIKWISANHCQHADSSTPVISVKQLFLSPTIGQPSISPHHLVLRVLVRPRVQKHPHHLAGRASQLNEGGAMKRRASILKGRNGGYRTTAKEDPIPAPLWSKQIMSTIILQPLVLIMDFSGHTPSNFRPLVVGLISNHLSK